MGQASSAFNSTLSRFTNSVESGDGTALANLFTESGTYEYGFYGMFTGRDGIRLMLEDHFWKHAYDFEWRMFDPVIADGVGYSSYRFSYRSKLPEARDNRVVFEGISQFVFNGPLIASYREVFNTGIALCQLGFHESRIQRHLEKLVARLLASDTSD